MHAETYTLLLKSFLKCTDLQFDLLDSSCGLPHPRLTQVTRGAHKLEVSASLLLQSPLLLHLFVYSCLLILLILLVGHIIFSLHPLSRQN